MDRAVFVTGCASPDATGAQSSRPFSFPGIPPSLLAAQSVRKTLSSAQLSINDVDFVLSVTQTPDFNNPGMVSFLLAELSAEKVPGMELKLTAAGPVYALELAAALIRGGKKNRVLVCGCDFLSRYYTAGIPAGDALAARCGDGAASFLVTSEPHAGAVFEVLAVRCGTLSEGMRSYVVEVPQANQFPQRITREDVARGRHLPKFDRESFVSVLQSRLPRICTEFLTKGDTSPGAIKKIAAHSPAGSDFRAALGGGFGAARFYDVFENNGYVGAAGVGSALARISDESPAGGEIVLLAAAGAGINFGFAILRAQGK